MKQKHIRLTKKDDSQDKCAYCTHKRWFHLLGGCISDDCRCMEFEKQEVMYEYKKNSLQRK